MEIAAGVRARGPKTSEMLQNFPEHIRSQHLEEQGNSPSAARFICGLRVAHALSSPMAAAQPAIPSPCAEVEPSAVGRCSRGAKRIGVYTGQSSSGDSFASRMGQQQALVSERADLRSAILNDV
jgi:hypothetical protein